MKKNAMKKKWEFLGTEDVLLFAVPFVLLVALVFLLFLTSDFIWYTALEEVAKNNNVTIDKVVEVQSLRCDSTDCACMRYKSRFTADIEERGAWLLEEQNCIIRQLGGMTS